MTISKLKMDITGERVSGSNISGQFFPIAFSDNHDAYLS